MLLKTSKGRKFDVDWADVSTIEPYPLVIQLQDARPLGALATLFDGNESISRTDPAQGDKVFDGYSELVRIQRSASGVQVSLKRATE